MKLLFLCSLLCSGTLFSSCKEATPEMTSLQKTLVGIIFPVIKEFLGKKDCSVRLNPYYAAQHCYIMTIQLTEASSRILHIVTPFGSYAAKISPENSNLLFEKLATIPTIKGYKNWRNLSPQRITDHSKPCPPPSSFSESFCITHIISEKDESVLYHNKSQCTPEPFALFKEAKIKNPKPII